MYCDGLITVIHTSISVINLECNRDHCKAAGLISGFESAWRSFRSKLLGRQPINKVWHHTLVLLGLSSRIGLSRNGTAEGVASLTHWAPQLKLIAANRS